MMIAASSSLSGIISYLTTGANWHGDGGFLIRLVQHLLYSAAAVAISAAIALPLGLYTGHTRRGGTVLSLLSNASRALPTLGLLVLCAFLIGVGFQAAIIPLVFLAVPSMLLNTSVGIQSIDPALIDASYGMGLRPRQVLFRVEVPVALPLIVLGLRTAAIQVVATATIAAYVGLGGLGRYIIDGEAQRNFAKLGAGAVLVAGFAIATEGVFLLVQRLVVSPGLRARNAAG